MALGIARIGGGEETDVVDQRFVCRGLFALVIEIEILNVDEAAMGALRVGVICYCCRCVVDAFAPVPSRLLPSLRLLSSGLVLGGDGGG